MNIPFVSRRRHEREMRAERDRRNADEQKYKEEIERLTHDLPEIIEKLVKVSLTPYEATNMMRLCLDIDERMLYDCLRWGADDYWINYFVSIMSRAMAKRMRGANMFRPNPSVFIRGNIQNFDLINDNKHRVYPRSDV